MEQRRLGSTGLQVSRLALGTMSWGRDTDEDDASSQLKAFLEVGGTLIDTADVYVDGESMFPRYKPGETAWVNPSRPARRGDDVIVQLHSEDEDGTPFGFIKEYVSKTATHLVLCQYNPQQEVRFLLEEVKSVHTIVQRSS